MNTPVTHAALSKLLKTLKTDDYVWLLHLFNKDQLEYKFDSSIDSDDKDLIEEDIQSLNNVNDIREILNIVNAKSVDFNERDIAFMIKEINKKLDSLSFRSIDLSKYKSDNRLLNYAIYKLTRRLRGDEDNILRINNNYIKFLYLISVNGNKYRTAIKLQRIEKCFSDLLISKDLHFKDNDHTEFYKWCLKYIFENENISSYFNSREYRPVQDSDFRIAVLSILDQIHDEDENVYIVLREKISNAWYQKTYRKKNKGREHYYFLTDKVSEALEIISRKENLSVDKTLERLISQYYAQHCIYQDSGEHKYSN